LLLQTLVRLLRSMHPEVVRNAARTVANLSGTLSL
jgi:hypothetical protein